MNLEEIKKNYENYDDSNIELIATTEAYGLHEEVIQILKNEIKKRNLSDELLKSIEAQTKEGILKNVNLIRAHSCPVCHSKTKRLNATIVGKVSSFIIYSSYEKEIKIACSDCLDEFHRKANINSALFGWWGIPWGPINTISSLLFNNKMKRAYHRKNPSEVLTKFVTENATLIESVKENPVDLSNFLKSINDNIL